MASRRHYPKAKPFAPPPDGVTIQRAAPPTVSVPVESPPPVPSVPSAEKPKRRWLWFVLIAVVGLSALGAVASLKRNRALVSSEGARDRLRTLQREWWESEGLGTTPTSDPTVAFDRLLDRQREWWDREQLASDGDPDGSGPLKRLEERQRAWWVFEELAKGKAADPARAMTELDHQTSLWWKEVKPTRLADPDPAEKSPTKESPPERDTPLQLADQENTRAFLQAGGTEDSERAVQLGLKWLATQQLPDGRWPANGKFARARAKTRYASSIDIASTALALLPFLAHGQTHRAVEGRTAYAKVVENGLNFLRSQQKADGDLSGGRTMYVHALAAIALCEAYDASSDPVLKEPCQKAIDFLVAAQAPRNGGWRYNPGMAGDMSVTSWCLMALKSAQMSGLHVPTKSLDGAREFLRQVTRADGGYNYQGKAPGHSPPTPAVMTAAGIVCRQYLEREQDLRSPEMVRGADIIRRHPPQQEIRNFYYYYYATYALLPIGGEAWKEWNPKVRDLLVGWQDQGEVNPEWKGSWAPEGSYQLQAAGRVGVTSLALLTLEVYYRHLPLNRPDLGEMAKPSNAAAR